MAGEKLGEAYVNSDGLSGDRKVIVVRANGRIITSRSHFRLLRLKGTLGPDGQPFVSGHKWDSPQALRLIREATVPNAEIRYHGDPERFDVLPLLVATDGALAAFKHDPRRLRPNIVVGDVDGLAERLWPGKCLRIGRVLIAIRDLRARCVMTTFEPDTLAQNRSVLKEIVEKFEGKLALNCYSARPGQLRVGDQVELIDDQTAEKLSDR